MNPHGPRILVNGATGALGRATMAALRDYAPLAGTRRMDWTGEDVILVPGDGRVDPDLLSGIDAIINCAGRVDGSEAELVSTNVTHVENLASAAIRAGVRRFVQVSSFSVYGPAEYVDRTTPLRPVTAYGRSKLAAERVLADMSGTLSSLSVRIPFMFDRSKPALLGPLINLLRRTPVFPVAPWPVRRSMLSYPDAASILVAAASSDEQGTVNAADPLIFDFALLGGLMRECGLRAPHMVHVPAVGVRLLQRVAPGIGMRLFASSELSPADNWAVQHPLPVGIGQELKHLLSRMERGVGS